MASHLHVECPE